MQRLAAKKLFAISALALSLLTIPRPIFAHHGTAGYDTGKTIGLTGTVTKYDWSNPHVVVYMDAKEAGGNVQHWAVELAAPLLMARFGWNKNSIKPGDQLVTEIHPSKNGAPVGIGATATMLLKWSVNGTPLPHL